MKTQYDTRGFKTTDYHGDNEFNTKSLETSLIPILIHIYDKNEHVKIIKQSICTIKDHIRYICHAIPFKRHTSIITRSLIYVLVDLLNISPSKDGVSDTLSPPKMVKEDQKWIWDRII